MTHSLSSNHWGLWEQTPQSPPITCALSRGVPRLNRIVILSITHLDFPITGSNDQMMPRLIHLHSLQSCPRSNTCQHPPSVKGEGVRGKGPHRNSPEHTLGGVLQKWTCRALPPSSPGYCGSQAIPSALDHSIEARSRSHDPTASSYWQTHTCESPASN